MSATSRLADAVDALRTELEAMVEASEGFFDVEFVDVELAVRVDSTKTGKLGVSWILAADVEGAVTKGHADTIRLRLRPSVPQKVGEAD